MTDPILRELGKLMTLQQEDSPAYFALLWAYTARVIKIADECVGKEKAHEPIKAEN